MDSTVNNLAHLADLSEPTILHETRHRYYNQQIYTHVGPNILLSVNPHRVLNIYNGKPKPINYLQTCNSFICLLTGRELKLYSGTVLSVWVIAS